MTNDWELTCLQMYLLDMKDLNDSRLTLRNLDHDATLMWTYLAELVSNHWDIFTFLMREKLPSSFILSDIL